MSLVIRGAVLSNDFRNVLWLAEPAKRNALFPLGAGFSGVLFKPFNDDTVAAPFKSQTGGKICNGGTRAAVACTMPGIPRCGEKAIKTTKPERLGIRLRVATS
ncbi:UNVERIFIED_ORG: hypothetical protein ABIB19_003835 [Arthrobacter sp. UYEF10]